MRKYEMVMVESRELVGWKCDVCGMDLLNDDMEAQEALSYTNIGGYSSIFGDGSEIQLDICQYCLQDKLGQYLRII